MWHDRLIFKMRQNGVSGRLLKLFQNYLNNRKQRVVLNGFPACYSTIESGVSQGSVLGPLLFHIYIIDLERNIKSNVQFFADDTMLLSIVSDPVISANELNQDLKVINQWAYQWNSLPADIRSEADQPHRMNESDIYCYVAKLMLHDIYAIKYI